MLSSRRLNVFSVNKILFLYLGGSLKGIHFLMIHYAVHLCALHLSLCYISPFSKLRKFLLGSQHTSVWKRSISFPRLCQKDIYCHLITYTNFCIPFNTEQRSGGLLLITRHSLLISMYVN